MNKNYLVIVSVLLILVVAVGGYAFYKANKQQVLYQNNPIQTTTPTPTPAAATTPDKNSPSTSGKSDALVNQIPLTIPSIKDGDKVSTPRLLVSGTTSPKADVNINGTDYVANAVGKFSTTLTLDEGENAIYVTATDENGKISEWNATVTYEPVQ